MTWRYTQITRNNSLFFPFPHRRLVKACWQCVCCFAYTAIGPIYALLQCGVSSPNTASNATALRELAVGHGDSILCFSEAAALVTHAWVQMEKMTVQALCFSLFGREAVRGGRESIHFVFVDACVDEFPKNAGNWQRKKVCGKEKMAAL